MGASTLSQAFRRSPTRRFEPLPLELMETADVSPIAVTNDERKWLTLFSSGQNRTQEADGSIPFSSTELLRIFGRAPPLKRIARSFRRRPAARREDRNASPSTEQQER